MLKNLVLLIFYFNYGDCVPVVELAGLGKLEGTTTRSFNGRTTYTFEGIPYAEPPIGTLRFQKPKPVKPWTGTWKANTLHKCLQYNQYTPPGHDFVIGDENCLYLNIFTPTLAQNASFDVIVYIHGGSFMFNHGGLYRPDYLLDHDVVVVTLNYRLGPLGFLSTEDDVVPANNGLRDQILALTFIKNNIKNFGGDPNSVSLVGNSAGGVSVHSHYLAPKSRGLFNRGLSLSGTTLVPWAFMEQPLEKTRRLAALVGCLADDSAQMVNCLKTRPARQLLANVKEFIPWLYIPFSPFGLVVDSWSQDPIFPNQPHKLLTTKQVFDAPWIVTHTNSEGLYPAEQFYDNLEEIETRWDELIPLILDYNYTVPEARKREVNLKIRRHFLSDQKLSKAAFRQFLPILSERLFINGIQEAAKLQAAATKSDVFSYQFSYRGQNSWFVFKDDDGSDFGAAHADDIPYIFKLEAVDTSSTKTDRQMVAALVHLVTSFAKTGKAEASVEWPPVSKTLQDDLIQLMINSPSNFTVGTQTNQNAHFWRSLQVQENEKD